MDSDCPTHGGVCKNLSHGLKFLGLAGIKIKPEESLRRLDKFIPNHCPLGYLCTEKHRHTIGYACCPSLGSLGNKEKEKNQKKKKE